MHSLGNRNFEFYYMIHIIVKCSNGHKKMQIICFGFQMAVMKSMFQNWRKL